MPAQPRIYRPSWFLRLYVRLEDFNADPTDTDSQDGAQPYQEPQVEATTDKAAVESQLAQSAAAGGYTQSDQTSLQAQSAALTAQSQRIAGGKVHSVAGDSSKGDDFAVQFVTVPMEMEIEDKGFRTPDELTATFPFQDLPLDPRIIRECRVEGWVGTVSATDFATPDKWHLQPQMSATSVLRFNGYIDLPEMEHDDAMGNIHIKARSYESVLVDGKINSRAKAYRPHGNSEPITTYVNRILSLYPPTSGDTGGDAFRAYWYAAAYEQEPLLDRKTLLRSLQTAASRNAANGAQPGQPAPPVADNPESAPDPNGVGDSAAAGTPSMPPKAVTEDGISVWDLITQACELCGCMPLYQPSLPAITMSTGGVQSVVDPRNCLLITPPQAFLDTIHSGYAIQGGARDGFSRVFSNGVGGSIQSDVRFMVWGHNVKKLKLSRKMGRVRPSGVEVRAYNPDAIAGLRVLSSRFPKHVYRPKKGKGHKATKRTEKGFGKIDVIRTFVLKGVRDQGMLDQEAVSIYHQLTRGELTIQLETDELASYIDPVASQQAGGIVEDHNSNPDLLKLCAGSPVHVTVAQKSTEDADLTICSLSEFYDVAGAKIVDVLTRQNDRWGKWRTDGSLDQAGIEVTAQRIQRAYQAARLPDVYYCRSVRLHFSADEGFHASIELCNYMPDNDPDNMDDDSKALNNQRKRQPVGTANVQTAATAQDTAAMVYNAEKASLPR